MGSAGGVGLKFFGKINKKISGGGSVGLGGGRVGGQGGCE